MSGYTDYEPDVLAADKAVRRIRAAGHRTRADWIVIGKGLARVQALAMAMARSNDPTGKRYNAAHAEIMDDYPNLRTLAKDTRSHALWLHNHRDEVEAWMKQRSPGELEHLTHPKTIHQRFDHHHRAPPPPQSHSLLDRALNEQEGFAAFADEQQRQHPRTLEEDAHDMLERHGLAGIARLYQIFGTWLESPPDSDP